MTALYDLFYIDGAHKQARELPEPASDIAYAKVDDDYLIPAESAWLMSTSDEALSRVNGTRGNKTMNGVRSIVILAAIAVALHGATAVAEEQPAQRDVSPATGKTAEEIVQEARARVESGRISPDRMEAKQEKKQKERRSFYFGLGFEEDTHVGLGEVYRVAAAQRNSTPLEPLVPWTTSPPEKSGSIALIMGYELTPWLDIELARNNIDSFWQWGGGAYVFDPTLEGIALRTHEADQYNRLDFQFYSLSLLPRWQINDYVAVFGRLGVGYSDTAIISALSSQGWVSSSQSCSRDSDGKETCTTSNSYATRDWGDLDIRRTAFVPVAGIGVQLFGFMRLEYTYRADVPVGNSKADISSNLILSFRLKTAWLDGSFIN